jgi:hypothetical protein
MAKNYADIYNSSNPAIALEQRFYAKLETSRGTLIAPTGSDFFYTLGGGTIESTQAIETSPHRSGRHHNNIIKKKWETNFSFSTYFNIDTTLGAAAAAEIDPAVRLLFKSLMGYEDASAGAKYQPTTPNLTFTLLECGDKYAKQTAGCFVQGNTMAFPGDGEATCAWTGNGTRVKYLGIGKSVTLNNAGNTITLVTGDGALFENAEGAMVMIIEANGTTRSADTPDGTPRKIVSVVGDVVTLDGAVLADADGSGLNAPIYLSYYEPSTPVAIDNPQTGLVGSFAITGYGSLCARSINIEMTNNHELANYCYGSDSLSSPYFVPGERFTAKITFETNLTEKVLKLLQTTQDFTGQEIALVLGDPATRHFTIDIPRAIFSIPSIPVPETGSIPISFEGNCYQTTLDAGDEIVAWFK